MGYFVRESVLDSLDHRCCCCSLADRRTENRTIFFSPLRVRICFHKLNQQIQSKGSSNENCRTWNEMFSLFGIRRSNAGRFRNRFLPWKNDEKRELNERENDADSVWDLRKVQDVLREIWHFLRHFDQV